MNKTLIDGVDILSQSNISSYNGILDLLNAIVFGLLVTLFAIIISSVVICIFIDKLSEFQITLIFLGCILIGVVSGIIPKTNQYNYIEYKVTIDDTVNFNEFYNKYEILDQDEKIYTIRIKDDKAN